MVARSTVYLPHGVSVYLKFNSYGVCYALIVIDMWHYVLPEQEKKSVISGEN